MVPLSINKPARRLAIGLNAPATVKPGRELTIEYQADYPGEVIIYGVNTAGFASGPLPDAAAAELFYPKESPAGVTTSANS